MPLVVYPSAQPNMGNIFGDAWRKIKSDPLILAPQFWVMKEVWKATPEIVQGLKNSGQEVVNAFRPPPPPQQPVDALTSALSLGSGGPGGEPGSSSLPIVIGGAAAAALLLLLAFGKKKTK